MNTKILLTVIAFGFMAACSKNVYNTTPTLKLKSLSSTVIPQNGSLTVDLQVTDKEGDVTDSLFVRKVRLNKKVRPTLRDFFALKIPDAPNTTDGTVRVDLDYQNYLISATSPIENDTLVLKFALKDKANHVSDTVTTGTIVVIRI